MLGRLVKRRIDWNSDYCFKVRMLVGKDIVISLVGASVSPSLRLTTLTRGREGWRVRRKSIAEDFLGRRVEFRPLFYIERA